MARVIMRHGPPSLSRLRTAGADFAAPSPRRADRHTTGSDSGVRPRGRVTSQPLPQAHGHRRLRAGGRAAAAVRVPGPGSRLSPGPATGSAT